MRLKNGYWESAHVDTIVYRDCRMNRTNSFVKGFASTTAQKILIKLIGLIVTPIVLTYLDTTEYGIWVVIGSVLGYVGLMDFGVTGATAAIAAKHNTQVNDHHINTVINNAFVMQSLIAMLILIVGFTVSFYFPDMFQMGAYSKEDAWLVFVMAIIGYAISFPPKSLKGLIQARQMISLSIWLEFFLFLFTTLLNLAMLDAGFGLLALPAGTIVMRLLAYPLFFYFAKKAYPRLGFDLSVISIANMKEIFGISAYWFVGMIAAMVIYSTDTILIGMFLSTAMVTLYALTFRLTEVIREFIYSISFTMMPAIGQIMGEGNALKAREIYLRSQPVILSLGAIGAIFVYFFNSHFVRFWVGEKYDAGDSLALIFAAAMFISIVFHASSLVISADLKLKGVTVVRIIEAGINIALSVWLVRIYGLMGVALGTLIAGLLTSFWLVPYMAMRHLGISVTQWIRVIVLKTAAVFVVTLVWTYGLKHLWSFGSVGVAGSVLLFGFGAVSTVWWIAMDEQTKRMVRAKVRK